MKYKTTHKDRYGNMRSLELDTGENNLEVPPMTSMIPQYEAVGGLAENHPGEPKGSDTVPAWLTPGEFVVNKEAVDIYGPQIKKMNDVGREIQDGNMNPNQAPPMYAEAGTEVNDLQMWKQQLMEREGGYRSDIYDPFPNDGKWEPTTGYGHLLDDKKYPESMKGKPGPFKTEAAAREQFEKDVGNALIDAQSNIGMEAWAKLQPQQQWGLTNMAFQLGRTKQAKFEKMIKAIQAEDYEAAKMHSAFNRNKNTLKYDIKTDWHKQTPTRVEDFNYFMSRWDPVNMDVPVSKPKSNLVDPGLKKELAPGITMEGNVIDATNFVGGETLPVEDPSPVPQHLGGQLMDAATEGITNLQTSITEMIPKFSNIEDTKARINKRKEDVLNKVNTNATAEQAFTLQPGGLIPGIDYPSEPSDNEEAWYRRMLGYDSRTSSPKPVTNAGHSDYGPLIPRHPIFDPNLEYADKHPGAGPVLGVDPGLSAALVPKPPAVPTLPTDYRFGEHDTSALPTPTPAAGGNPSLFDNDSRYDDDSSTMTGIGGPGMTGGLFAPPEFPEKYRSADTPPPNYGEDPGGWPLITREGSPFTSAYDQMVQEELEGKAAYDIPPAPPPPTDYRLGEHDTGMIPVDYGPTPPTDYRFGEHDTGVIPVPGEDPGYRRADLPSLLEVDTDLKIADSHGAPYNLDKWHRSNTNKLEKLNKELRDLHNIPPEKRKDSWEGAVAKKRLEIEDLYSETTELKRVINQKELIKEQNKKGAAWKKESQLRNDIQDYENVLSDPAAGAGEKSYAKSKIKELEEKLKETGGKAKDAESEAKLADVVNTNPIDQETEESMYNHWSSAKGQMDLKKIYAEGDSNPNWNKAKDMLKGTLGFLFGDIFDSGELGRAIAVYLGSRALGYDHGSSIGYVSKQYLKRVDAKNAAYDKWLLANANKYTKKSLSKFKKTRDPAHLIPIGSVPRSQGEQAKWYDKDGKARMAYKFKIKDAAGDDHIYWSWDKSGKSEVEEGWHQDPKSVPGTDEFKAQAKKYRDDIEEQLKVLLDKYDIDKHRDPDKKIYANKYHTTITPAIDKDAVYSWAIDNKVQPEKIGSFLEQAMILATKEARGSDDKPGSILPYLDRVTIDERTKDYPKLMTDGEYAVEDTELVRLNQKITENFGAPTIFYNAAWEEWQKGKRKSDDKSWPAVFKELAANEEANEAGWTPFALFVDNLLHEWMEEHKAKRHSGDFVLDKAPE